MQYAATLPNLGGTPTSDDIAPFALRMEELGYHSLFVGDHIALPVQPQTRYVGSSTGVAEFKAEHDLYEAFTVLSYLAGITKRIRLGIAVQILPYRHPVVNSKMITTLDVLSKGRVILGVGTGWCKEEFESVGAEFSKRGAVTDEHINIFKAVCTGQEINYQGRHYQIEKTRILPMPVQQPHPPIWVGGVGPNARRRAALLGDGWYPIRSTPEELSVHTKEVLKLRAEQGIPTDGYTVALGIPVHFGDQPLPEAYRIGLRGSPEEIIDQIKVYEEAGVNHMTLRPTATDFHQGIKVMERFAAEVMPRV